MSETDPGVPSTATEPAADAPVETAPAETAPVPDVPAAPPVETVTTGTSNESPVLPPSAQAAVARAHALLTHFQNSAGAIKADLERYVPPGMISAAETEVAALLRGLL